MSEKSKTTVNNTAGSSNADRESTREEFLEKLRKALRRDGDFPASARVVTEIRRLASDPTTTGNKITELILQEPTLGTRVLHVVNSSFYRRARQIMTVSQAVVQIGMRPLAELCAGLVLLQKFVPAARQNSSFAKCLNRTITTALLTSAIQSENGTKKASSTSETGYLAGSFFELGTLLLAFYFPQLFEKVEKRSITKKQSTARSIFELTGLTPAELSLEVIRELKLPDAYEKAISFADSVNLDALEKGEQESLYKALYAGKTLSEAMVEGGTVEAVQQALVTIGNNVGLKKEDLLDSVEAVREQFRSHCASLDIRLPEPPLMKSAQEATSDTEDGTTTVNPIAGYLEEIRQAVTTSEPPASIITSVLEAFAYGMGFDRVLLMLLSPDKSALQGRMVLGSAVSGLDPRTIRRPAGRNVSAKNPDALAVSEGRAIYSGEPIFEGGWPLVAMPIGPSDKAIGVVYADMVNASIDEVPHACQTAIVMLMELLEEALRRT